MLITSLACVLNLSDSVFIAALLIWAIALIRAWLIASVLLAWAIFFLAAVIAASACWSADATSLAVSDESWAALFFTSFATLVIESLAAAFWLSRLIFVSWSDTIVARPPALTFSVSATLSAWLIALCVASLPDFESTCFSLASTDLILISASFVLAIPVKLWLLKIEFLVFCPDKLNSAKPIFLAAALTVSTPFTLFLIMLWASFEDLTALLASLATSSTARFVCCFSASSIFFTCSIEFLTAVAVSAITLIASSFCTCNFSPSMCWALIALMPSTI